MKISIKKLTEDAQLPMRAHDSDAGYDLYSSEAVTLQPLERRAVKTGISFALPELLPDREVYGRVAPRSGLAVNKGLDVLAGVIDASYRGEIAVVLINLSSEEVSLDKGAKIAQLIIERYHAVEWEEVPELPPSERGEGGFGSSGE
jgi:dUTP pyrophosphatase